MQTDCRQVATDVFCDVAERTAFMFGEVCSKTELLFDEEQTRCASMSFHGPINGCLELVISHATCRQIAANFVGVDPDDDKIDLYAEDAVKELLNVTCGNILTEMAGTDPVFDLSVPSLQPIGVEQIQSFSDDERSIGLLVDDEPVLVRLIVENVP